jgi:hypothetical protein
MLREQMLRFIDELIIGCNINYVARAVRRRDPTKQAGRNPDATHPGWVAWWRSLGDRSEIEAASGRRWGGGGAGDPIHLPRGALQPVYVLPPVAPVQVPTYRCDLVDYRTHPVRLPGIEVCVAAPSLATSAC